MSAMPSCCQSAGLLRRLAAIFYDSLLLLAVGWAVTAIAVALRVAIEGEVAVRNSAHAAAGGPVLQLALLASIALFFAWFWTHSGQTLGMQAWKIRLQTVDGSLPGWDLACIRLLAAVLSAACLGAGYWWILIDRDGCAWHDRISATRVVRVPGSENASARARV